MPRIALTAALLATGLAAGMAQAQTPDHTAAGRGPGGKATTALPRGAEAERVLALLVLQAALTGRGLDRILPAGAAPPLVARAPAGERLAAARPAP